MPIDLERLSDEQLEVAAVCLQDYARWRRALADETQAAAAARRGRLQWQALGAALRLGRGAIEKAQAAGAPLRLPATALPGGTTAVVRQWVAVLAEQARRVQARLQALTDEQTRLEEAQSAQAPEVGPVENVAALSEADLEALSVQAEAARRWQAEKQARAQRLASLTVELNELGGVAGVLEMVCQTLLGLPAELLEAMPGTVPAPVGPEMPVGGEALGAPAPAPGEPGEPNVVVMGSGAAHG